MAVTITPNIRTTISGENVTPFDEKIEFDLTEKIETNFYVSSTNTVTIPYSNIDNIQSIVFYSENEFIVSLSIDIGTVEIPNVVVVPITVTGMFHLDTNSDFIDTLSAITISTDSTSNISVTTNIYGIEAEV